MAVKPSQVPVTRSTPIAPDKVYGLNRLLRGVPALVIAAVGAIVIAITVSEFFANSVAFASAYNWFHM